MMTQLQLMFKWMVETFRRYTPYEVYNIAHLVLDDNNFEDSSIAFQLTAIDEGREEYLRDNPTVTDADIDRVVAFLKFMQAFPEDDRILYEDDDE